MKILYALPSSRPPPLAVSLTDGAQYVYRTVKDIRFPLSVRNERAVMQRLSALVQASLDGYPTTLEEDRAMLKVPWFPTCLSVVVLSYG